LVALALVQHTKAKEHSLPKQHYFTWLPLLVDVVSRIGTTSSEGHQIIYTFGGVLSRLAISMLTKVPEKQVWSTDFVKTQSI